MSIVLMEQSKDSLLSNYCEVCVLERLRRTFWYKCAPVNHLMWDSFHKKTWFIYYLLVFNVTFSSIWFMVISWRSVFVCRGSWSRDPHSFDRKIGNSSQLSFCRTYMSHAKLDTRIVELEELLLPFGLEALFFTIVDYQNLNLLNKINSYEISYFVSIVVHSKAHTTVSEYQYT